MSEFKDRYYWDTKIIEVATDPFVDFDSLEVGDIVTCLSPGNEFEGKVVEIGENLFKVVFITYGDEANVSDEAIVNKKDLNWLYTVR